MRTYATRRDYGPLAPEGLRATVDVIPPEVPALARITRGVKAAFDPKGILNPGRLYAGL